MLIDSGRAAVRLTTPAGDNVTLGVLGRGDVVGESGLFTPQRERTATVQALEHVSVYALRQDDLHRLRREHPEVNDFFLQLQAQRIERLSRLVVEAHHLSADKRIARRLYEIGRLYVDHLERVTIPLTQEEIAQISGTTRPTVNQVLQRLSADGIVAIHRGTIELLQLKRLRSLCAW